MTRLTLLTIVFALSGCAHNGNGNNGESHAAKAGRGGLRHHGDGSQLTLTTLATGAMLFDDLGGYHYPITTQVEEAQTWFDQGLRLTYAFNHDEAARSFAKAAELDPSCAMCFWGVALVLGPNYNVPMLPDRAAAAWDALRRARAVIKNGNDVEQALIAALSKRYKGPAPVEPPAMQPFNQKYAAAMREVASGFPADLDVQTLFAEALMDVNPWKLWRLDGLAVPGTEEILGTLESVLARNPNHPGANHYYIHAVEASPHPEKGLPSAERLPHLIPGAGHIVHMPAHIYQRIGRYEDASIHNRKAAVLDEAYIAKARPFGYYPMYLGHNYGFLAYSASMEGRSAESLHAARKSVEAVPPQMLSMMPGMDFFAAAPIFVMVRFARWSELLDEPRPDSQYQVLSGLWLHGHALALAATGKLEQAKAEHRELVALIDAVPIDLMANLNPAREVLRTAAKVLEAEIAERDKQPEALPLWAEAVALEDKLAYSEPADWFYPIRHHQAAALLKANRAVEAETVLREDLRRNPKNGWALFGLAQALKAQGKHKEATQVTGELTTAWQYADLKLTSPVIDRH